jgi:F420-dependent oxidoreductase-like protein
MKVGLHLVDWSWFGGPERAGASLAQIAQTAEQAGFDSIAVADHVWQHPYMGGPERDMLECYTILAYLAAHTRRTRLIAMCTAAPYRPPGLLAKIVTTLDILSGGRAWLGIGAGDYEEEARGLGLPYLSLTERFEQLEETLQICQRMWAGDERPFEGRHFRLERPVDHPRSIAQPHPPILVAGNGERRTLPLVARYANACNLRPSPEIPRKLEVLRQHCQTEGRDYDAIEKTCVFAFNVGEDGARVGELVGQLRWLAGMGIQTVFGRVEGVDRVAAVEVMGREVIPAVADL